MRKFFFFIVVIIATLLTACRTPQQAAERETVYRTDTVVSTHIVTVTTPPDSASIEALLRCDSAGNVLIDALVIEQSKNADLFAELDKMGRLIAKFKSQPDTVYVSVTDTTITTTDKQTEVKVVEVERKRTIWESFLIVCGLIGCMIFCIFVVWKIIKNRLLSS
jgi:hypothetical protein